MLDVCCCPLNQLSTCCSIYDWLMRNSSIKRHLFCFSSLSHHFEAFCRQCFLSNMLLDLITHTHRGLRAQWKAPPVSRCRLICKAASVDPFSTFAQFISVGAVALGGCSPTTVLIQGMKRNDLKSSIFNALDQDLQRNQDIKKRSAASPNPGYLVSISEMILARYGDFNQLSAARMVPMNQPT